MVTTAISPTELNDLEASLLNTNGKVALHDRFRALFTLKSLKTDNAVDIISKGALFPSSNAIGLIQIPFPRFRRPIRSLKA